MVICLKSDFPHQYLVQYYRIGIASSMAFTVEKQETLWQVEGEWLSSGLLV